MTKLKITDAEVIKSGERELLDVIIGDLDWEAIEKIIRKRHLLRIQDDVEFRQGDLVVYENTVAYQLDFDAKVTLTVLFDRDGNYLSLSTSGDFAENTVAMDPEDTVSPVSEDASGPDEASIPNHTIDAAENSVDDKTIEDETTRFDESAPQPSSDPDENPDDNISGRDDPIEEMHAEINEEKKV